MGREARKGRQDIIVLSDIVTGELFMHGWKAVIVGDFFAFFWFGVVIICLFGWLVS